MKQDFYVEEPNKIWCTDFTYLKLTDGSFRYNCSILDLYDRSVVSSITAREMTSELAIKALEKAQKRVEARYFESRKELLKYDDVMNEQRNIIYKQRNEIMTSDNFSELVYELIGDTVESICENNIPEKAHTYDWNLEGIRKDMINCFALDITDIDTWKNDDSITEQKAFETLEKLAKSRYKYQLDRFDKEFINNAERQILLGTLDSVWKKHLQQMDYLQTGIGLRGYAQKNPLYEYKQEALELFKNTINSFKRISVSYISRIDYPKEEKTQQEIHRNDLCPCGSGLKYKHCCGKLK